LLEAEAVWVVREVDGVIAVSHDSTQNLSVRLAALQSLEVRSKWFTEISVQVVPSGQFSSAHVVVNGGKSRQLGSSASRDSLLQPPTQAHPIVSVQAVSSSASHGGSHGSS
jgi:hypothetical protein